MFVHELAQRMPDTFAAMAANCAGKPHFGFEAMAPTGPPVSMLLVTGKEDHVIRGLDRSLGADWWDGFRFASRAQVVAEYRRYNRCVGGSALMYRPARAVRFRDHRARYLKLGRADSAVYNRKMECVEEGYDCAGNVSIVTCSWEGGHDIMMGEPKFIYEFFASHQRSDLPGVRSR